MKQIFYVALLCFIPPLSQAMFCNTLQGANGWIDNGVSEQDILAACGPPDSKTEMDQTNKTLGTTQYLTYQQQAVQVMPKGPTRPMQPVSSSTSPNVLVAEVSGNTIKSLALNGSFVSSASCPNGGFVQVGGTIDTLTARCGVATQTSYQYSTNETDAPSITVWTYQLQGGSSLQIQFQNGVVSSIHQ